MQIDTTTLSSTSSSTGSTASSSAAGGDFAKYYASSLSDQKEEKLSAAETAARAAQAKADEIAAERTNLRKELQDYLNKSPAEHLREKVLKELGLTEEDLAKMPPQERQAAEAKIAQRIRDYLTDAKEKSPQDETMQGGAINPSLLMGAAENSGAQSQNQDADRNSSFYSAFFASLLSSSGSGIGSAKEG